MYITKLMFTVYKVLDIVQYNSIYINLSEQETHFRKLIHSYKNIFFKMHNECMQLLQFKIL